MSKLNSTEDSVTLIVGTDGCESEYDFVDLGASIGKKINNDCDLKLTAISQNLNTARGLILFPEGTTSDGTGILPFKSSLFHIPASNNWKVHCASISYATPGNEPHPTKSICWWDDTPFLTHFIRFLKVTKTYVTITFSSETVQNSNRKVVAKEAEVLIKNTFEPVHQI